MNKIDKKLIMLSAMYENGGNTTHRLLDGHPELFVYPFESQLGTKYVTDHLSALYPVKYRWPVFPNSATAEECYKLIIDEECRVRANTPFVSKFREADFIFSDKERLAIFARELHQKPLTRPAIVQAFFQATFMAWKNYNRSGQERYYVGYSPIVGVDGEKIINDYEGRSHVLHVVRNPFSAYADTKKRPAPLSIDHYMMGWATSQYYAKLFQDKYPDNFFVIRYEDIIESPVDVLGVILRKLGMEASDSLAYVSWNGQKLNQVYPWGTIKVPTMDTNLMTAQELNKEEIQEIYARTYQWIEAFNFTDIYEEIR